MANILQGFTTYGIFPTILAVLIMLIYVTVTNVRDSKLKRKEKQQRIDEEALRRADEQRRDEAMLEAYKKFAVSLLDRPEHSVEEEKRNNNLNEFIYKQLNSLVEKGADRAYMVSYHNGGRDLLGRGFQKLSITAESVEHDIPRIMTRYQQLPRALFPVMYASLEDDGVYDVEETEAVSEGDPMTYQFLIEHGVCSAFFRALKRSDGVIIGFVAIEFVQHACNNIELTKKELDRTTDRITGALLGYRDDSVMK